MFQILRQEDFNLKSYIYNRYTATNMISRHKKSPKFLFMQQNLAGKSYLNIEFLLIRPSWGATATNTGNLSTIHFYSHAPRGARRNRIRESGGREVFLLTRPSRGVTSRRRKINIHRHISTHTPLAGRDRALRRNLRRYKHFYSHAPRGA